MKDSSIVLLVLGFVLLLVIVYHLRRSSLREGMEGETKESCNAMAQAKYTKCRTTGDLVRCGAEYSNDSDYCDHVYGGPSGPGNVDHNQYGPPPGYHQ